jgi:hypothetical protein
MADRPQHLPSNSPSIPGLSALIRQPSAVQLTASTSECKVVLHIAMTGYSSLLGPGPFPCPDKNPCRCVMVGWVHGSIALRISAIHSTSAGVMYAAHALWSQMKVLARSSHMFWSEGKTFTSYDFRRGLCGAHADAQPRCAQSSWWSA